MTSIAAMKDEMIKEDPEFKALAEEHEQLETQLEALYQRSLPSQDDEIEIKRIKHEKLRIRDAMMLRIKNHESVHA